VIPSISIDDIVILEEAGQAQLTISLSEPTTTSVFVDYATTDQDAVEGEDYQALSGSANFPAGQTSVTITLPIIDDQIDETDEVFVVNLTAPTNATIADPQGTVTILDNDEAPIVLPVLSIDDVVLQEDEGIAQVSISLDQIATTLVSVDYATADQDALDGVDYQATAGQITIPVGQSSIVVTIPILVDDIEEQDEIFLVNLSAPVGATIADAQGTVTILDDDEPVVEPTIPTISINDVTVFEDEGIAELNICLDQATTLPVSVFYATADQAAQEIEDFQFANGIATFAPGETCTTLTINIEDDRLDEQDEVFVVNLSGPSNATLADAQGTVTILDNDEPSIGVIIPNLTISDITVEENQSYAHLQVCLDQPTSQAVTIECTTINGTAVAESDFVAATDVLTIPAGQTCHQASFSIIDDNESEETESFFVEISNAVGANIQDGSGEVTILDNDDSETINPTCPDLTVTSGAGTITIGNLLAPVEIVQVFNSVNQVVFQCLNNCDATEIIDNLPAGDYTVIINCYDNAFGLLCREEFQVIVSDGSSPAPASCQGNVLFGGSINGQESTCGAFDPIVIGSVSAPAGGDDSSEIEYLWLASTQGCPRELVDQIDGATGPTYDPGTITQTTYFVRCARRKGCNVWVESNCVVKEVNCEQGVNTTSSASTNRNASATITTQATKQIEKEVAASTTVKAKDSNKSIDLTTAKPSLTANVTLFPNPTVEYFSVNANGLNGQAGAIYVSNNMGQIVKEISVNAFDAAPLQVQLGNLPSGMYQVTIVAADHDYRSSRSINCY